MQYRYQVVCSECGVIDADTEDELYDKATAHRRAGYHEGNRDHSVSVEIAQETNEYRCPACHIKLLGEEERDEHARTEPGVKPDAFVRV